MRLEVTPSSSSTYVTCPSAPDSGQPFSPCISSSMFRVLAFRNDFVSRIQTFSMLLIGHRTA